MNDGLYIRVVTRRKWWLMPATRFAAMLAAFGLIDVQAAARWLAKHGMRVEIKKYSDRAEEIRRPPEVQ